MSLSQEERDAIHRALKATGAWSMNPVTTDEAIWNAAKNWAFEQAAKVCDEERASGDELADLIRALKDTHG